MQHRTLTPGTSMVGTTVRGDAMQVHCTVPDGSVVLDRDRFERLRGAIESALRRYDNPREPHNVKGGVPRGELARAMMTDLRDTICPGDLDPIP